MTRIQVGETMPDFIFNTGYRNDVHLYDGTAEKTVLWVVRYIGCPPCRYDAHIIGQRINEFKAKNANVFVLMQSDQAHIQEDLERTGEPDLAVEIIADPEMKIYKALDIRAAADKTELRGEGEEYERYLVKGALTKEAGYTHGDYEGDELQLPAQFIIDRNGTVLLANYAKSMGGMYTVDELLEKL